MADWLAGRGSAVIAVTLTVLGAWAIALRVIG